MANTLRFKRGLVSGIPTAALGEPLFTTDTFDLYIGNGTGNTRFQKYIASGTTSQLLRGDGSLLTMPIVLTSPTTGQVLKYDGTNWVNSADAGVTGSGTAGQVTYWGSSSTITGSNNLFWDAANSRLGIGTNTPAERFVIKTDPTLTKHFYFGYSAGLGGNYLESLDTVSGNAPLFLYTVQANSFISLYVGTASAERARFDASGNFLLGTSSNTSVNGGVAKAIFFGAGDKVIAKTSTQELAMGSDYLFANTNNGLRFGTNNAERARITSGGNFIINNASTDNGLRFQVTGDGYFSGSVGIGTSTLLGYSLRISKAFDTLASNSHGISVDGQISAGIVQAYGLRSTPTFSSTAALSTMRHFYAEQGAITSGGTITNQYGFWAHNSLTGATNNYGFYGDIASGTGRWNFFANGTANNYMAGSLGIGTTSLTDVNLRVSKNISGGTIAYGSIYDGQVQSGVTTAAYNIQSGSNVAAGFTLANYVHYRAVQGTISGTVTNQYGFVVAPLTSGTNIYGFYGDIASGTGRWNLYMNGTAANYLAGRLGVGTTTPTTQLHVLSGTLNSDIATFCGANLDRGLKISTFNTGTNDAGVILNAQSTTLAALAFSTNSVERMRIDASGNLGLGVTPSAWRSNERAFQIGTVGSISQVSGAMKMSSNSVYLTGTPTYITSNFATLYSQNIGEHQWYTAPSGTAGANITFTQAMTLTANGNLLINTTTDSGEKIRVNGTILISNATIFSYSGLDGTGALCGTSSAHPYRLVSNNVERLQVKTNGQVRFVPLSAAPSGAEAGDVYYNSTDNKLYCYNGTSWNALF